jgi:hypothetical protein
MRLPLIALATVAALAAAGLFAVPALSGGDSAAPAISVEPEYQTARQARALKPADGARTPRLARGGAGATVIRHLVTKKSFEVETNFVLRILCPRGFDPITGGVLSGPGVAISNSSRVDPESGEAEKRSWYVGVTNLERLEPQSFRGTIVCVRGL